MVHPPVWFWLTEGSSTKNKAIKRSTAFVLCQTVRAQILFSSYQEALLINNCLNHSRRGISHFRKRVLWTARYSPFDILVPNNKRTNHKHDRPAPVIMDNSSAHAKGFTKEAIRYNTAIRSLHFCSSEASFSEHTTSQRNNQPASKIPLQNN